MNVTKHHIRIKSVDKTMDKSDVVESESNSAASSQSILSQNTHMTSPMNSQEPRDPSGAKVGAKVGAIPSAEATASPLNHHTNAYAAAVPANNAEQSIEQVDKDVAKLVRELAQFEAQVVDPAVELSRTQMVLLMKRARQTLLRLNLSKNLVRCELDSHRDEGQLERRLFLKSIVNFERNLELLKNENSMITAKNLKLIRYCRQLKTDKIKRLKGENAQLRRRLQNLQQMLDADDDAEDDEDMDTVEAGPTDSIMTTDTVMDTRQATPGTPATPGSNVNMLDTLGRLASHVLRNGDFIRTTSDRTSRTQSPE